MVCRADDQLPGHAFASDRPREIALDVELTSNDYVPQLEIIQNGNVARTIPLKRGAKNRVQTKVGFDASGWFLVRAITDNRDTFRFASTAPYYVEIGETKRRISRASVEFFLDWLAERRERVGQRLDDPAKLREVLRYHDDAQQYWQKRLTQANAE